jgi:hypothetical protein
MDWLTILVHDFRLPPWWKWYLRSSGILHCVKSQKSADIGQIILTHTHSCEWCQSVRNWYRYVNRKCLGLCPIWCGWFDVKTVVTQVRCVLILELYEIIGFSSRCKCRETNISASYYYVYGPPLKCIGYTPRCGKFVEVPLLNERTEAFGRMAWSIMQGYLPLGSACSTRRLFLVGKEVGAWSWPLFFIWCRV